jgi:hypothetical protein
MSRLALAIAAFAASGLCSGSVAGARTPVSYSFGRTGGNIAPFTVTIGALGAVHVQGPVQAQRQALSTSQIARLSLTLQRERIATLSPPRRCPGMLPDFASQFITIGSGPAAKTIVADGNCSARFKAAYAALAAAVGLRY